MGFTGFGTTSPYCFVCVEATGTAAITFGVSDKGTSTPQFVVLNNGNSGFGTSTPYVFHSIAGNTLIDGNATTTGSLVVGTPTAAPMAAGTISAQAVYDDNVLLTDWVFDKYFTGHVLSEDNAYATRTLPTIEEEMQYAKDNRHLPTIEGRTAWDTARFSLGHIVTQLWQTLEIQAIHIWQLFEHDKEQDARMERLERENQELRTREDRMQRDIDVLSAKINTK